MKWSVILLFLFTLTSCVRYNYYLSPFQSNSNTYHVMPLKSDHVSSASYLHGGIAIGGSNDYRDDVFAFTSEYYRAHSFGSFEAYYGADFSFGYYNVKDYLYSSTGYSDSFVVKTINDRAGEKIFGGYGVKGGIALVVPYSQRGGEWRVLGFEINMENEFGQYLNFRNHLPDLVAQANMNASFFPTFCFTTEAVSRSRHYALSYKLSIGGSFRKDNLNYIPNTSRYGTPIKAPGFFGQTINYTRDRGWSIYYQGTFASHAGFFQLGFIKQVKSRKLKTKSKWSMLNGE